MDLLEEYFRKAKQAGLGLTLHIAEVGNLLFVVVGELVISYRLYRQSRIHQRIP